MHFPGISYLVSATAELKSVSAETISARSNRLASASAIRVNAGVDVGLFLLVSHILLLACRLATNGLGLEAAAAKPHEDGDGADDDGRLAKERPEVEQSAYDRIVKYDIPLASIPLRQCSCDTCELSTGLSSAGRQGRAPDWSRGCRAVWPSSAGARLGAVTLPRSAVVLISFGRQSGR